MKKSIAIVFSLACGSTARYRPTTPEANACENSCEGIARSCQAANRESTCARDLSACRARCFEFHGGEYAHATAFFWEQPVVERK